jgi:hypothetical protein
MYFISIRVLASGKDSKSPPFLMARCDSLKEARTKLLKILKKELDYQHKTGHMTSFDLFIIDSNGNIIEKTEARLKK